MKENLQEAGAHIEKSPLDLLKEILECKPVSYRSDFTKICESVTAGVMLSQAYYWTGKSTKHGEGWFEKTSAEWYDETGLTDKQQQTARHILSERGFMESLRKGDRGRMCSRVNHSNVHAALVIFYADRQKGESDQIGKKENLHRQNGVSKIGKKANLSLQRLHSESTAESGSSSEPFMPNTFEQSKTRAKKPTKEFPYNSEIQSLLKIVVESGVKESTISSNTRMLMLKAVELHGLEFCERAMRGRVAEAARKGAGLALTAFLDPEAGDWMDRCARVATGPVKVLTMAPSIAETIMDEIEGQWKAAQ